VGKDDFSRAKCVSVLLRGSQLDRSTLRQEFEQRRQAQPWSGLARFGPTTPTRFQAYCSARSSHAMKAKLNIWAEPNAPSRRLPERAAIGLLNRLKLDLAPRVITARPLCTPSTL
jgi:hypothetical protein